MTTFIEVEQMDIEQAQWVQVVFNIISLLYIETIKFENNII